MYQFIIWVPMAKSSLNTKMKIKELLNHIDIKDVFLSISEKT